MASSRTGSKTRGFTLIEVLIALVVLAFGMLALARTLGRSAQEELEAQQRALAMTLAAEMTSRIGNNPKQAVQYVEYCNVDKGTKWSDLRRSHGY